MGSYKTVVVVVVVLGLYISVSINSGTFTDWRTVLANYAFIAEFFNDLCVASISANDVDLLPILSVGLSVGQSVGLSLSGKCTMAKWLIGSGCSLGGLVMSVEGWVYRWVNDHRRGRDNFRSEFGASHCNQWGICCIVVLELLWAGPVIILCLHLA